MAATPREYFEQTVPEKLERKPDLSQKINAVYQFDITGDEGGTWTVDLVENRVHEGPDEAARCTVTVKDQEFMKLVGGQSNPQMAFMTGKLKVAGDLSLAMKLTELLRG